MSLSRKIKSLRVENNMSQEKMAEILNVSRQSISKYEQGSSVPDYEKLTQIVKTFNVTFDYLLDDNVEVKKCDKISQGAKNLEISKNTDSISECKDNTETLGENKKDEKCNNNKISIIDYTGKVLSSYYKFNISKIFKRKEHQPYAILLGVDKHTFWGENTVPLGWYACEEDIKLEIEEIYRAIANDKQSYSLKYYVNIKSRGFFDIEIDN